MAMMTESRTLQHLPGRMASYVSAGRSQAGFQAVTAPAASNTFMETTRSQTKALRRPEETRRSVAAKDVLLSARAALLIDPLAAVRVCMCATKIVVLPRPRRISSVIRMLETRRSICMMLVVMQW